MPPSRSQSTANIQEISVREDVRCPRSAQHQQGNVPNGHRGVHERSNGYLHLREPLEEAEEGEEAEEPDALDRHVYSVATTERTRKAAAHHHYGI